MGAEKHRLQRTVLVAVMAVVVGMLVPGLGHAGGPGKWTKIPTTGKVDGFDQAAMFRTPDGKLHVVWKVHLGANKENLRWATISQAGKLLASGNVLPSNWGTIDVTPHLMKFATAGVRVVFKGAQSTSGFFSTGSVYTSTSPDGQHWTLEHVSMSSHTVLNGTLAATAENDGTPVGAVGLNDALFVHVGIDPAAPAGVIDTTFTQPNTTAMLNQTLVTDTDGSVWMAWYRWTDEATQGVYVQKILPSAGPAQKAPSSGIAANLNAPLEQVALAARAGGGIFVAYCVPTKTKQCAQVDLWKAGAAKARLVPGSKTGGASRVAIAAGPQGRISVAWIDVTKNVIRAVRTNTTGTAFGPVRTVKVPPKAFVYDPLEIEGSSGRLDIVANVVSGATGFPIQLWHTQILPGLSLKASPHTFSHTGATVTFTVTDAGQPLANAGVSCLGHKGKTNANGKATIHFPSGTPKGNAVATASKGGYNSAKITVKVT